MRIKDVASIVFIGAACAQHPAPMPAETAPTAPTPLVSAPPPMPWSRSPSQALALPSTVVDGVRDGFNWSHRTAVFQVTSMPGTDWTLRIDEGNEVLVVEPAEQEPDLDAEPPRMKQVVTLTRAGVPAGRFESVSCTQVWLEPGIEVADANTDARPEVYLTFGVACTQNPLDYFLGVAVEEGATRQTKLEIDAQFKRPPPPTEPPTDSDPVVRQLHHVLAHKPNGDVGYR